jgi:hypothetical protein
MRTKYVSVEKVRAFVNGVSIISGLIAGVFAVVWGFWYLAQQF